MAAWRRMMTLFLATALICSLLMKEANAAETEEVSNSALEGTFCDNNDPDSPCYFPDGEGLDVNPVLNVDNDGDDDDPDKKPKLIVLGH
ncbi:hypothetical protein Nepgr_013861 [Nepenthes gracilis]|uniref:Uncharacterized protein n=1 Tax=Nepenthes gracilis TaxID=150966 RepID=A0AAD3SI72_NEPGR|nr:hypothetical protein Nepgr_013861 [Nepenthes gracilis]